MEISFNTFTAFVAASSRTRMDVVRNALLREDVEFDPSKDYWLPFRRTVVAAHRSGEGASAIRGLIPRDARKVENYAACAAAYLKWLGRREIQWIGGSKRIWTSGELAVRVNPELIVAINEVPHAIQLWCRKDSLDRSRVAPVLCLLAETHGEPSVTVGILDVQRGRLLKAGRSSRGLEPLLAGEAASFVAMWHRLRETTVIALDT